ncbi:head GIN domain-containing protein [Portibacter marinus]|uniref:head GIN domain-containing protein n=1 Tax=Portibacter marinus TaxID=2898660 RepID=UPI001F15CCEC|nr:head GIN domain-containing protein [Portibacter marinus]
MNKINFIIAILMAASFHFSTAQRVRGEGPVVEKTIELDEFSNIGLGLSANVYLTQGNRQLVKIKGQQNIIDLIEKDVDGDSWEISFPDKAKVSNYDKLEIYITIQELEGLNIGGSGSILGQNKFKNLNDLKLNIGGSGSIGLELDGADVTCNIGGSGSIKLAGTAESMDANIGGSGSVKAIDLKVQKAKVNTAGSGSVSIDVSDELSATIVGSGGVQYKGNPKINQNVMGSGRIKAY